MITLILYILTAPQLSQDAELLQPFQESEE